MRAHIDHLALDIRYRYPKNAQAENAERHLTQRVSQYLQSMMSALEHGYPITIEHIQINLPPINMKAFSSRPEHYFAVHLAPLIRQQFEAAVEQVSSKTEARGQIKLSDSFSARLLAALLNPKSAVSLRACLSHPHVFALLVPELKRLAHTAELKAVLLALFPEAMLPALQVAINEAGSYGEVILRLAQQTCQHQGNAIEPAQWQQSVALLMHLKQGQVQLSAAGWELLTAALARKRSRVFQEQLQHWSLMDASGSVSHFPLADQHWRNESVLQASGLVSAKAVDALLNLARKRVFEDAFHEVSVNNAYIKNTGSHINNAYADNAPDKNINNEYAINVSDLLQNLKRKSHFLQQLQARLQQGHTLSLAALMQCVQQLLCFDVNLPESIKNKCLIVSGQSLTQHQSLSLAIDAVSEIIDKLSPESATDDVLLPESLSEQFTNILQELTSLLALTALPLTVLNEIARIADQYRDWQRQESGAVAKKLQPILSALKKHYAHTDAGLSPAADSDFWLPLRKALFHVQSGAASEHLTLVENLTSNLNYLPQQAREKVLQWLASMHSDFAVNDLLAALNALGLTPVSDEVISSNALLNERLAAEKLTQLKRELSRCQITVVGHEAKRTSALDSALSCLHQLLAIFQSFKQLTQKLFVSSWCDKNTQARLGLVGFYQEITMQIHQFYQQLPSESQQKMVLQSWWLMPEGMQIPWLNSDVAGSFKMNSHNQYHHANSALLQQKEALEKQIKQLDFSQQGSDEAPLQPFKQAALLLSRFLNKWRQTPLNIRTEQIAPGFAHAQTDALCHYAKLDAQLVALQKAIERAQLSQLSKQEKAQVQGETDAKWMPLIRAAQHAIEGFKQLSSTTFPARDEWRRIKGILTKWNKLGSILKQAAESAHQPVENGSETLDTVLPWVMQMQRLVNALVAQDTAEQSRDDQDKVQETLQVLVSSLEAVFRSNPRLAYCQFDDHECLMRDLNAWAQSYVSRHSSRGEKVRETERKMWQMSVLSQVQAWVSQLLQKDNSVNKVQSLEVLSELSLLSVLPVTPFSGTLLSDQSKSAQMQNSSTNALSVDNAQRGFIQFNALVEPLQQVLQQVDIPALQAPIKQQLSALSSLLAEEANALVFDAGLALFWPFLQTLFSRIGLLNTDKRLYAESGDKAMALLMYIYCKHEQGPDLEENVFVPVCANMLLGNEPLAPLTCTSALTETEKQECDNLMALIIEQWPALKGMSCRSFRQMFIQRQGILLKVDFGYAIAVEKQAQDILLAKLPWGFGIIRLPWLSEEMIDIRWQSGV
ncbi:contractile injection system tape measure protein [Alteromonas sp. a30]|uniref:contractile injection system tape measure protein n=1 Tax=Alteromonas sp. a30 TaxID=2730917 RepID=UPI0022831BBD|nr:contractile injection system tape measure protein [Alteromonas sp. a30]MCY7296525.1 hypothetical protein [Alteromonas sp. a30]